MFGKIEHRYWQKGLVILSLIETHNFRYKISFSKNVPISSRLHYFADISYTKNIGDDDNTNSSLKNSYIVRFTTYNDQLPVKVHNFIYLTFVGLAYC